MGTIPTIEELDSHFAIAGIAQVVAGNGGLHKVCITSPAASAEIYPHGAHITSWKPRGAEGVIFLSKHSRWEEGHAIRGGIPICSPGFAPKRTIPMRRRTDLSAPRPGNLNPLLEMAMRFR